MSNHRAELYTLKLHEMLTAPFLDVRRVPGGWIYTCQAQTMDGAWAVNSCFVPYIEEFRQKGYERMRNEIKNLTPAHKLGYKVGDRFITEGSSADIELSA